MGSHASTRRHAAHDDPLEASIREVPQLTRNEEIFNLDGQIKHKLAFIKEMLEDESLRSRVQKCYMLFSAVERMIESPNGWVFTKLAMPLYSVFGFKKIKSTESNY
ncbi:GL20677 [Drosophila persimilis]|uniref:GL20677 n=1 Tax=Drosophila persimilis TaxID=7234 RepID=B4HDD1_DROPE|nr:GL20677 [Drosophila persimilis]